ncbi:hypothetical protein C461_00087 [Halorubrum aidingense JCM 13560]|uniref:ParB/Sulfiredoxin domain-containing protein n=1 Tax=Halorubrum aidingense JCM 13560 TaxID=1230454 RepID=M0PP45_9EURY|nr:hypothetical protein [Halorubrum aidingense]EMA70640.1 hypothetical protein C461_00087 [Halorubrum aidingense JCM 13560]
MNHAMASLDDALRTVGRRLVTRHPQWNSMLLRARDGYARAYVRLRWGVNSLRYAVPPDPYRFIEVDPATLERVVPVSGPKFRHAGAVVGGDWDRPTLRFEEMDVFRAYKRHFEDGVPWRETEFYDRIVAELEDGHARWGCRTQREFDERCERLDRLYETIRTEGYRTQEQLRSSEAADPIKGERPSENRDELKTERLKNEIAVNIGRDGELFFSDGRNRLSIAKLLGLDSVPVRVLRRHPGWQSIRDAYVRGEPIPEAHRDHPDLVGLDRGER